MVSYQEQILDAVLVDKAMGGDESALEAICRRYEPLVFRLCLVLLGQRQDAQDATQEVLLKLVHQLRNRCSIDSLPSWLCRVANTTAVNQFRQRKRNPARHGSYIDPVLLPDKRFPGEKEVESEENCERIWQVYLELPAEHRQLFDADCKNRGPTFRSRKSRVLRKVLKRLRSLGVL